MGALASTDNKVIQLGHAPRYEAYQEFIAGSERFNHQDYAGAIPYFRRAVALDSTIMWAYNMYATSYSNMGRWHEADSLAQIAARQRDRFTRAERASLDWLLANIAQDRQTTFRIAQEEGARDSSFTWLYLAGFTAYNVNRPRKAIETLTSIQKPRAGWLPYWTVLASAYHQVEDFESEQRTIARADSLYPGRLAASRLRVFAAQGDARRIALVMDSVSAASTDEVNSPAALAVATADELRAHGHDAEARELLVRARTWLAGRPLGAGRVRRSQLRTTADVMYAMGRYDSAGVSYAALASEDTTDIAVRARVASAAAMLGDTATATRVDAELSRLKLPYRGGEPSYGRATIAAARGDKEAAARLLERSFADGWRFTVNVHRQQEFQKLRGYAPFDAILRPKG
jgi:tetratricopeptide (TPR) repeat protein